ncbi:efflux RND transporter periplasmic adaptor subunit [Methylophaga sp. OBS4]|uniref:efflux RND transporter periplasmic adaptor subunit n=1 Tax=Methylophaga sp. OBS4 TaxID=2991935 RepID=UPI002251F1D1|nr:HlyD family efflux transporter periplasmic adaptor subunit [Methylophaga sp. OBS4]MCX4186838.1 HlyD family efflux transporter periplasmic adaptor subunit [Methylophaga sp. OBS4]
MNKKIALPIVIIVVAVIVFIVLKQTRPDTTVSEQVEKKWLVEAVMAELRTLAPEITIYGRVETPRDAQLKAALEADVVAVNVLEGDVVAAGQLLVKLDDTDVLLLQQQRQADVDEISALIDSEQKRYQRDQNLLIHQQQLVELADKSVSRARRLEQTRLASQATLDEALAAHEQQLLTLKQLQHDINEHPARLAQLQASKKRAGALLEQAAVNLARTEIRAPFDGRIAQLNVAMGDRVRAGDDLVSIYDLNNLEVRAQLPGRYIGQVRQMMQQDEPLLAEAQVDGQPLQFRLARLSGAVRQDSGGLDGLFTLINDGLALPLGTFVELKLRLAEQQQVVALPFSALYGRDRIYRIEEDGYLQSLQIERVGEKRDAEGNKKLLIRSPELKQGDKIAATQLPNAMTGLRVEVFSD